MSNVRKMDNAVLHKMHPRLTRIKPFFMGAIVLIIVVLTVFGIPGRQLRAATSSVTFPLRVSANKRYIEDSAGKPYFIQGIAAWSLIAGLTNEATDQFLDDRRQKGFNVLLVNLLEHKFVKSPPNNAYGDGPFTTPNDFSTPNEAYFAHADWVINRANEKGFVVMLVASYVGYNGGNGGDEGWWDQMVANGAAKIRDYGRFLGKRYKNTPNLIWIIGGDFNPPDKSIVRAMAEGIRDFDTVHLQTPHVSPDTPAATEWAGESWLDINNIYSYNTLYPLALTEYNRAGPLPFFLAESDYENEHFASDVLIRSQAYYVLLSGACGQIFGNNPIWHFDGPGLWPATQTWQQALNERGSVDMSYVQSLFANRSWEKLVPDQDHTFLTAGLNNDGPDRAVAALASDQSFGLIYMPSRRTITVALSKFTSSAVTAKWYDPTTGIYALIGTFSNSGLHDFSPTGDNAVGKGDWVLVIEATTGTLPTPTTPATPTPATPTTPTKTAPSATPTPTSTTPATPTKTSTSASSTPTTVGIPTKVATSATPTKTSTMMPTPRTPLPKTPTANLRLRVYLPLTVRS